MFEKKTHWLLYFIAITIVATLGIQFYWNYKNYEENKRQVTNEIQLSLDTALEEYYAILAKEEFTTIVEFNQTEGNSSKYSSIRFDSIFKYSKTFQKLKSLVKKDTSTTKPTFEITDISFTTDDEKDAQETELIIKNGLKHTKETLQKSDKQQPSIKYFKGKKSADSLRLIKNLKPIFLSVSSNFINYRELDSLIKNQFDKKKLPVSFIFQHFKSDTLFYSSKDSLLSVTNTKNIAARSTYIKKGEILILKYQNSNFEALKRGGAGISLSLLLFFLIISCMFYLLKIIRQQTELAAIKNDLISNITHEFKTPIATVSSAIEALENFNALENKEKTKKYLSMSSVQLKKLHQMVEKLLETATLDSQQLILNKETINIIETIKKLVVKYQFLNAEKEISLIFNVQPVYINIDNFHFENALSNLIDNAVKYGGNQIKITVHSILNKTEIVVKDTGYGIEKHQQEKIFEKFYRVPKGNTHDVKGFGIGLYYSKKIIEKHEGTLSVSSVKNNTIFKINLPNE
ncbi:putative two component system sensor histidine kinase [Polaribacter irgensii 23-P]|uniref:histidine kinase n=1 Tax=Polaribacter irgensii 23-P TaxID=313594 RepID=A4BZW2_9FLAO|nr:HAMP domain-containing sensor histidine kinase [Polaribacter irgensii]EAR12705.1 putative two component system sensor histidine kinase [Polaribacter irgensii 23-P]